MSHLARSLIACLAFLVLVPSAQAELLYKSNRVELYRVPAERGARNDHPLRLEEYALEDRLDEVTMTVADNEGVLPLLDEKARLKLGEQLARALRHVAPDEEIHMIVYRVVSSGLLNTTRWASSARVFVKDGHINAIFGGLEQFQNEFRDPGKVLPPMGSRAAPAALQGKLTVSGSTTFAKDRNDWILIPVTRPGDRTAAPSPQPAPAAASPAKPSVTWAEVEEGLTALDRMRQRGLLTQGEYDGMKQRLLDSAMPAAR